MKRIGKFLSSMPFAITLLVLLAAACAMSSAIPQGATWEQYAVQYGERTAGWIVGLQLDDAFHSWWFIGLSAFLCLNLLCCNLTRLPSLLKRVRTFGNPEKMISANATAEAQGTGDPQQMFTALRMGKPAGRKTGDGREMLFSAGNRAGFWGAWICHMGILLLILGFALGQMTAENYTVYALPGQTKPLENTGLTVRVDDFRTERTESGAVQQYTAMLTVSDPENHTVESGTASVNAPAALFGYKFFQNSVGWGADVTVLKNGEVLQKDSLCAGEYIPVKDKQELVVYLQAFYPDYVQMTGMSPMTASEELNNPAYLYRIYYKGELLGMNALMSGEEVTIDEYTVRFDHPRNYTLLAVKRDRFTFLVLLGGLITLAGLVLAFWVQPRAVWAVREDNGWHVYGMNRKGGALFRDEFGKAAAATGFTAADTEKGGND